MKYKGNPGRLPFCEVENRLIDAGEDFHLVTMPGSTHESTVSSRAVATAKKMHLAKEAVSRPSATRLNFYKPVPKGAVHVKGDFQFSIDAKDHPGLQFIVNTCQRRLVKEEATA